ncbi:hypothetical protein ACFYSC_15320 [Streptosporangium sp. NPDC004379]|uniref:hypothetical protein n=1 Tax=Streptosporangium sp. NPDC004379 TaxID=3366189 RepID=UPI00367C74AF
MRTTARTLLGLAAAAAVLAATPALASPASAATLASGTAAATTATAVTAPGHDYDDRWGPYYSKYFGHSRAMAARGGVWTDDSDRVHVEGRLYDRYSPSWLCGYVQVKFEDTDGDESTYWAKKCGSSGYRSFHFASEDVDSAQVRVCYWHQGEGRTKMCGRWNYVYEADGDDE